MEKKQRIPCLKWTMAILAVFTIAVIGIGFYGNENAHKGCDQFVEASLDIDSNIADLKRQGSELERAVNKTIASGIKGLHDVYEAHPEINRKQRQKLAGLTEDVQRLSKSILTPITSINRRVAHLNLSSVTYYTREYSFYRWLAVLLLLCWMMLLCLILLLGIGLASKCTLLVFCAFGIFTLVLGWMSAGLHLGISVGLGDFCFDPDYFFERLSYKHASRDASVLLYYLKCDAAVAANPFSQPLYEAGDIIRNCNGTLDEVTRLAFQLIDQRELDSHVNGIKRGLNESRDILTSLIAAVDCRQMHTHYQDGIEGACYVALPGYSYLILSAAVSGLLYTLLVVLASRAWRHFGSRKAYMEVEDDDPFLPRPDNSSPSYYSFSRGAAGRVGGAREVGGHSLGRHSTPPPAYNSNEFYRQYSDVNHSDDGRPDYVRETHA